MIVKTSVMSEFWKIEQGGGNGGRPVMLSPLCGLAYQTSTLATRLNLKKFHVGKWPWLKVKTPNSEVISTNCVL